MSGSVSELQSSKNRKGLVLGGGGAKGCYHVGVWQALKENGISFDAVTGTSIGALVGSFYVQQNIEPVTDFVMGMTPTEIARELPRLPMTMKEKIKGTKTILEFIIKYKDDRMDITPLKNHFDEMFDYSAFESSDINYACMTFNDTKQEARGFVKEEITADTAKPIIMASAACYPAFPKVEFEGEIYMDGGYADNVPIDLLRQIEPEIKDADIMVVDIHGPQEPVPPMLTPDMFYIQPLLDPGNSIDFSREHALRLYNQGYLETLKYLGKNPGYLYTFMPEDASLIQVMENYLNSQMEMHQIVLPDAQGIADNALRFALGYTPFELPARKAERYEYGRLIEALALMAKVEPVALYDYRDLLKKMIENLSQMHLTNVPANDFRMIEMLSNLKKDELTLQLHRMLVNGQGVFPSAIERIKDRISTAYTLAYVWYFAEELVKNLG